MQQEPTHPPENILTVSLEEAGMKLLRFLERRLPGPPSQSMLHKWIRTGQVRINGGRAKPFSLLQERDSVRVPPFATMADRDNSAGTFPDTPSQASPRGSTNTLQDARTGYPSHSLPLQRLEAAGIPVIAAADGLLVMNKPGGLAVQSGSGQEDSVAGRLKEAWQGYVYHPAPAHRLDRHTSGLLLAGLRHSSQQALHRAFAEQGTITKDYLAWAAGAWPEDAPCLLTDRLYKERATTHGIGFGKEGMRAHPGGQCRRLSEYVEGEESPLYVHNQATIKRKDTPEGFACAAVIPVTRGTIHGRTATLLLVRLFTGRTHQIRVQLASRGFPIIGDGRYGGPSFIQMLLHAWRLQIPWDIAPELSAFAADNTQSSVRDTPTTQLPPPANVFSAPPPWPTPLMPEEAELTPALARLETALL